MEIGTVCIKTRGRDRNRQCVVLDVTGNRVLVTGPKSLTGVRRRQVNITHISPTGKRVEIKPSAPDADVAKALGVGLPAPATRSKRPEDKPKAAVKKSIFSRKEKPKKEAESKKPKASIFKRKQKKAAKKSKK